MTLAEWLRAHAFLEPVARMRARVDAAIDAAAIPAPPPPDWEDYTDDLVAGVPLLLSDAAAVDLQPAGAAIVAVAVSLAAGPPGGEEPDEMRALGEALAREPDAARQIVAWLLGGDDWRPPHQGALRCVGWLALASSLRLVAAFTQWRDDGRWLRRYCPTCGSLPAMAQLAGVDPGRLRFLWCGCCGTRWRFGRTACPFCDVESQRLASLAIEGEGGLRIDYCESCRGYLKTYDGQGGESVMLADWTSLHLDLSAIDRGLRRLAASLYEIDGGQ